jgi:hypothetical protein
MIIIISVNHYHYIVIFSFWQYKKGLNTTIIFWNMLHLSEISRWVFLGGNTTILPRSWGRYAMTPATWVLAS